MKNEQFKEVIEVFEQISPGSANTVKECLENIEFEDTFPEDMVESRTDWEELRDRELTAHRAVQNLVDLILNIVKENITWL